MKALHLLLALMLTLTIGLGTAPAYAASKSDSEKTTTVSKKDTKTSKSSSSKKSSTSTATKSIPKNIKINSADLETLQLLPGVGPVTAAAILKYRKANGKFKTLDDLANVKGIGKKTLAKIKPYIKL